MSKFLTVFLSFVMLNSLVMAGCFSDYDCSYGYQCVKPPFSMEGTCMQVVDEFGTPTYAEPRDDSFDIPDEGECDFDLDCPIGFMCDPQYKVCVKK